MLIGVGPHARTFYLPLLARLQAAGRVRLAVTVDLESSREAVAGFLRGSILPDEEIYVEPFTASMPDGVRARLDAAVARHAPAGVIISTDPLSHRAYAAWALERGLNILLDKPISSRPQAVTDPAAAEGIVTDATMLAEAYARLQARRATCFSICAHRRYHPGIEAVVELLRDATARTGCPVTSIHAYHSDGQWRLPAEIMTQSHHSYHQGHGKISHSGHHFIDCVSRFYDAGRVSGKEADAVDVYSTCVQPDGLLVQLNEDDYERLFGPEYRRVRAFADHDLAGPFRGFGEIDVESVLTFRREGRPVCLAGLSLLHNGFSRRSWMVPAADLYKGNGRVKHEQHRIHVGPFLGVQVHSYQAKDSHARSAAEDLEVGGNNHFEVLVFRNAEMLGGGPAFERLSWGDFAGAAGYRLDRLYIEQVKEGAVHEFLDYLDGRLTRSALRSSIETHLPAVRLMSAMYRSLAAGLGGQCPVERVPWSAGSTETGVP